MFNSDLAIKLKSYSLTNTELCILNCLYQMYVKSKDNILPADHETLKEMLGPLCPASTKTYLVMLENKKLLRILKHHNRKIEITTIELLPAVFK